MNYGVCFFKTPLKLALTVLVWIWYSSYSHDIEKEGASSPVVYARDPKALQERNNRLQTRARVRRVYPVRRFSPPLTGAVVGVIRPQDVPAAGTVGGVVFCPLAASIWPD